jgi:hypothetical protein
MVRDAVAQDLRPWTLLMASLHPRNGTDRTHGAIAPDIADLLLLPDPIASRRTRY